MNEHDAEIAESTAPETVPDAAPAPETPKPEVEAAPAPEPLLPAEDHQRATGTPDWLHAATARRCRWGIGREMTRAAYAAAIDATAHHTGDR